MSKSPGSGRNVSTSCSSLSVLDAGNEHGNRDRVDEKRN